MKKAILPILFVFLFTNLAISQGCFPDGITFSSQEQIDQFPIDYPNCTIVEGDLRIQGENITNLDSLYPITEIYGSLNFWQSDSLSSIVGLYKLSHVKSIYFQHNDLLESLDGLENLKYIDESLYISSSAVLRDISALRNVKKVGIDLTVQGVTDIVDLSDFESLEEYSSLSVSHNPDLQSLTGIGGMDSLIGVVVCYNPRLKMINGFEGTKYIMHLSVFGNDSIEKISIPSLNHSYDVRIDDNNLLTNIQELSGLKKIDDDLYIRDNYSLASIEGLQNLDSAININIVGNHSLLSVSPISNTFSERGYISIGRNENLLDIIGFSRVKNANSIWIEDNPSLRIIDAFSNLDTIFNTFSLNKAEDLVTFKGFDKLKYIGEDLELKFVKSLKASPQMNSLGLIEGDFTIVRFDSLPNLSGFSSLKKIGGDATIKTNSRLLSLSGLNNLESVVGDFSISNNRGLISLEDLDSLKTVSGRLIIEDCENLKTISSLENLQYTGGITLNRLDSLETIIGFPQLNTLDGYLFINDLDNLKDLDGFKDIKKINMSLGISACDGLKDLKGLKTLKLISRTLSIYNCDSLENLQGLNNVSKIEGALYIANNERLNSLQGINNADLGSVEIKNNPSLSMCSVESVCRFIDSKYILVEDNGIGCNTIEEINEMCNDQGYYSDDVFPIIYEEPTWSVLGLKTEIPNIASTQNYSYTSEFVFCGNRYSKIIFEDINKRAYIRADHEKAYYRNREDCSAKEYLLYDYTLAVGDTAYVGWNQFDWIAKDTAAFVVKKVEYIDKYDRVRKRITLEYAEEEAAYSGQLHWLEGVGCEEHPFYPFAKMDDYLLHEYELLCFDSAGYKRYQSPNWSVCDTNYTSIGDLQKSGFTVSPNPFANQISITTEREEIIDIQLVSLTGQLLTISWKNNSGKASVLVSEEAPNGIYILRMVTANGYRNIKLVKSDRLIK